jgi:CheY-like chemotaxis protein/DNA-binding MarR family transcriptional regulator
MDTSGKGGRSEYSLDVMVVDDDSDAVEELVEYLSMARLRCKPATDAWMALKLMADGHRPDVVVTDLHMPELTGLEFAERLSRASDSERPEIIFVSANAGFDDAIAAIRLGARDMLTKPIDGPKLVQAVKSAQIARQLRSRAATAVPMSSPVEAKGDPSPVARKRAALNEFKNMRRMRAKLFPSELFSDPCWEMLLDLYDASLTSAEVTVTSLGVASGVPPTTALRRMEELHNHDLIVRVEDKNDKRRTIVRLSEGGLQAVEQFFDTYLGRRPG